MSFFKPKQKKSPLLQTKVNENYIIYLRYGSNVFNNWLTKQFDEKYCLLTCVDGSPPGNNLAKIFTTKQLKYELTKKRFLIIHPSFVTQSLDIVKGSPEDTFFISERIFKPERLPVIKEGYVEFLTDSLAKHNALFKDIIDELNILEAETCVSYGDEALLIVTKNKGLFEGLISYNLASTTSEFK